MYSSKIKDLIKRASKKTIGAIPVGLKVSFGGAKVYVEAQYEISGKVVIYLIGEGKKTIAKIDGSASGKKIAIDKLVKYILSYHKEIDRKYYETMARKFINELHTEVNVANGKGRNKVSTNMAIKNKVAASRKSGYKKPTAKKAAKKVAPKKTTTTRAAKKVTPKKAAKKSTAKGNEGNLVYVGTGTKGAKKVYQYAYKKITKKK